MKKQQRFYLEEHDINLLKQKALESGFSGRGWLSNLLHKIASSDICFMDSNARKIAKLISIAIKK